MSKLGRGLSSPAKEPIHTNTCFELLKSFEQYVKDIIQNGQTNIADLQEILEKLSELSSKLPGIHSVTPESMSLVNEADISAKNIELDPPAINSLEKVVLLIFKLISKYLATDNPTPDIGSTSTIISLFEQTRSVIVAIWASSDKLELDPYNYTRFSEKLSEYLSAFLSVPDFSVKIAVWSILLDLEDTCDYARFGHNETAKQIIANISNIWLDAANLYPEDASHLDKCFETISSWALSIHSSPAKTFITSFKKFLVSGLELLLQKCVDNKTHSFSDLIATAIFIKTAELCSTIIAYGAQNNLKKLNVLLANRVIWSSILSVRFKSLVTSQQSDPNMLAESYSLLASCVQVLLAQTDSGVDVESFSLSMYIGLVSVVSVYVENGFCKPKPSSCSDISSSRKTVIASIFALRKWLSLQPLHFLALAQKLSIVPQIYEIITGLFSSVIDSPVIGDTVLNNSEPNTRDNTINENKTLVYQTILLLLGIAFEESENYDLLVINKSYFFFHSMLLGFSSLESSTSIGITAKLIHPCTFMEDLASKHCHKYQLSLLKLLSELTFQLEFNLLQLEYPRKNSNHRLGCARQSKRKPSDYFRYSSIATLVSNAAARLDEAVQRGATIKDNHGLLEVLDFSSVVIKHVYALFDKLSHQGNFYDTAEYLIHGGLLNHMISTFKCTMLVLNSNVSVPGWDFSPQNNLTSYGSDIINDSFTHYTKGLVSAGDPDVIYSHEFGLKPNPIDYYLTSLHSCCRLLKSLSVLCCHCSAAYEILAKNEFTTLVLNLTKIISKKLVLLDSSTSTSCSLSFTSSILQFCLEKSHSALAIEHSAKSIYHVVQVNTLKTIFPFLLIESQTTVAKTLAFEFDGTLLDYYCWANSELPSSLLVSLPLMQYVDTSETGLQAMVSHIESIAFLLGKIWSVNCRVNHLKLLFRLFINADSIILDQKQQSVDTSSITTCNEFTRFRIAATRAALLYSVYEGLKNSSTQSFFYFTGRNSGLFFPRFKRVSNKGFGVLFWVKIGNKTRGNTPDFDSSQTLFHFQSPNDDYFKCLYIPSKATLGVEIKTASAVSLVECNSVSLVPGKWYSIAVNYSLPKKKWALGLQHTLKVFISGTLVQTSNVEFLNNGCFSSFFIGSSPQLSQNPTPDNHTDYERSFGSLLGVTKELQNLNLCDCYHGYMSTFYMTSGPTPENFIESWDLLGPMYKAKYTQNFDSKDIACDFNEHLQYSLLPKGLSNSDRKSHIETNNCHKKVSSVSSSSKLDDYIRKNAILMLDVNILTPESTILKDESLIGIANSTVMSECFSLQPDVLYPSEKSPNEGTKNKLILDQQLKLALEACFVRKVIPFHSYSLVSCLSLAGSFDLFSFLHLVLFQRDLADISSLSKELCMIVKTSNVINCDLVSSGLISCTLKLIGGSVALNRIVSDFRPEVEPFTLITSLLSHNSYKLCNSLTVDTLQSIKDLEFELYSLACNPRISKESAKYYLQNLFHVSDSWIFNATIWRRAPFDVQLEYAKEIFGGLEGSPFPVQMDKKVLYQVFGSENYRFTTTPSWSLSSFYIDNEGLTKYANDRISLIWLLNTLRDYYSYDPCSMYPLLKPRSSIPPHTDPSIHLWKNSKDTPCSSSSSSDDSLQLSHDQLREIRSIYLNAIEFLLNTYQASAASNLGYDISDAELKLFIQHIVFTGNRDSEHTLELLKLLFSYFCTYSQASKALAVKLFSLKFFEALCTIIQYDDRKLCAQAIELVILFYTLSQQNEVQAPSTLLSKTFLVARTYANVTPSDISRVLNTVKMKNSLTIYVYYSLITLAVGSQSKAALLETINAKPQNTSICAGDEYIFNKNMYFAKNLAHKKIVQFDAISVILDLLLSDDTLDMIKFVTLSDMNDLFDGINENCQGMATESKEYLLKLVKLVDSGSKTKKMLENCKHDSKSFLSHGSGRTNSSFSLDKGAAELANFKLDTEQNFADYVMGSAQLNLPKSDDNQINNTVSLMKEVSIVAHISQPLTPSVKIINQDQGAVGNHQSISEGTFSPNSPVTRSGSDKLFKNQWVDLPFKLLITIVWESLKSSPDTETIFSSTITAIWVISRRHAPAQVSNFLLAIIEQSSKIFFCFRTNSVTAEELESCKKANSVLLVNLVSVSRSMERWFLNYYHLDFLSLNHQKVAEGGETNARNITEVINSTLSSNRNPWNEMQKLCTSYCEFLFFLLNNNVLSGLGVDKSSICTSIFRMLALGTRSVDFDTVLESLQFVIMLLQSHSLSDSKDDGYNISSPLKIQNFFSSNCESRSCFVYTNYSSLLGYIHESYVYIQSMVDNSNYNSSNVKNAANFLNAPEFEGFNSFAFNPTDDSLMNFSFEQADHNENELERDGEARSREGSQNLVLTDRYAGFTQKSSTELDSTGTGVRYRKSSFKKPQSIDLSDSERVNNNKSHSTEPLGNQTSKPSQTQDHGRLVNYCEDIVLLYSLVLQHYFPLIYSADRKIPKILESDSYGRAKTEILSGDTSVILELISKPVWSKVFFDVLSPSMISFEDSEMKNYSLFLAGFVSIAQAYVKIQKETETKDMKALSSLKTSLANDLSRILTIECERLAKNISLRLAVAEAIPSTTGFLNNVRLLIERNNLSYAITMTKNTMHCAMPDQVISGFPGDGKASVSKANVGGNKKLLKFIQSEVSPILNQLLKNNLNHLQYLKKVTSVREVLYRDPSSWWTRNILSYASADNKVAIGELILQNIHQIEATWSFDQAQDQSRMIRRMVSNEYYVNHDLAVSKSSTSLTERRKSSSAPYLEPKSELLVKNTDIASRFKINTKRKITNFNATLASGSYIGGIGSKNESQAQEQFYIVPTPVEIVKRFKCSRVMLLHEVFGYLDLTKSEIHWTVIHNNLGHPLIEFDKMTPGKNKETNFEFRVSTLMTAQSIISELDTDFRHPISEITELQVRAIAYQISALEIFTRNRKSVLIKIENKRELEYLYNKIIELNPKLVKIPFSDACSPQNLVLISQITRRWQIGQLSNFDYLMALNTLAGRSYNDLAQYPVFPWILKDYESELLDLENPQVYRDLTKPVGALSEDRLERFVERYRSFEDPMGIIKKFYYGTHYSSPANVSHFLIRNEPFISVHILLQNGKLDHADRQFNSIEETWRSCVTSSWDVKELIPEFFYQPEFLVNHSKLDFGVKQDGKKMDHVLLPPWAQSSPVKFIEINRKALESEYVSERLHHWIDLIFGYKQAGVEAEKAHNVFYYLTYRDHVNMDLIKDPQEKQGTLSHIKYFGQTPIQLFTAPHPARNRYLPLFKPVAKPVDYLQHFVADLSMFSSSSVQNLISSNASLGKRLSSLPIVHVEIINIEKYYKFKYNVNNINNKPQVCQFVLTVDLSGQYSFYSIDTLRLQDLLTIKAKDASSKVAIEQPPYAPNALDSPFALKVKKLFSTSKNIIQSNRLNPHQCAGAGEPKVRFHPFLYNLFAATERPENLLSLNKINYSTSSKSFIAEKYSKTNVGLTKEMDLSNFTLAEEAQIPDQDRDFLGIANNDKKHASKPELVDLIKPEDTEPILVPLNDRLTDQRNSFIVDDMESFLTSISSIRNALPLSLEENEPSTNAPKSLAESSLLMSKFMLLYLLETHYNEHYGQVYEKLSKSFKDSINKSQIMSPSRFNSFLSSFSSFGGSFGSSYVSDPGRDTGNQNMPGSDLDQSVLLKLSYDEWQLFDRLRKQSQNVCQTVFKTDFLSNVASLLSLADANANPLTHFNVTGINAESFVENPIPHLDVLLSNSNSFTEIVALAPHSQPSCINFSECGKFLIIGFTDGAICSYEITLNKTDMGLKGGSSNFMKAVRSNANIEDTDKKNLQNLALRSRTFESYSSMNIYDIGRFQLESTWDLTKILNQMVPSSALRSRKGVIDNGAINEGEKSVTNLNLFSNSIDSSENEYKYAFRKSGSMLIHDAEVLETSADSDLNLLVSCSSDCTIVISSLSKMEAVRTLRPRNQHGLRRSMFFGDSPYPKYSPTAKDREDSDLQLEKNNSWNVNLGAPAFIDFANKNCFDIEDTPERVIVLPSSNILIAVSSKTIGTGTQLNKHYSEHSFYLQMYTVNGLIVNTSQVIRRNARLLDWAITPSKCHSLISTFDKSGNATSGTNTNTNQARKLRNMSISPLANKIKEINPKNKGALLTKRELVACLFDNKAVMVFDLNTFDIITSFELPLRGFSVSFGLSNFSQVPEEQLTNIYLDHSHSPVAASYLFVGCEDSKLLVVRF